MKHIGAISTPKPASCSNPFTAYMVGKIAEDRDEYLVICQGKD
jgi:hypothetical protein